MEESIEELQQPSELIRRYQHQVDLVIVGGGDGTLNAAIDGLVDTSCLWASCRWELPTTSLRTLDISEFLSEACAIIAKGQIQQIDLGWVNGKHFFNASLGLSVQITQLLTKETKRRWGVLATPSPPCKRFASPTF